MNHPPSHSPQKIHPRFLLNDKRKDINGPRSISTFLSGFQVKSKELKKKISKKKVEKKKWKKQQQMGTRTMKEKKKISNHLPAHALRNASLASSPFIKFLLFCCAGVVKN